MYAASLRGSPDREPLADVVDGRAEREHEKRHEHEIGEQRERGALANSEVVLQPAALDHVSHPTAGDVLRLCHPTHQIGLIRGRRNGRPARLAAGQACAARGS